MFGRKTLKSALISTTALIGAAMVLPVSFSPTMALATAYNITSSSGSLTLITGDSLTIGAGGTVANTAVDTPAVTVTGAATTITLDSAPGTINTLGSGTNSVAILVTGAGSDLTGGITNNGQIGAKGNVLRVENGAHISGTITNNFFVGNTLQSSGSDTIVVTGAGSDISGLFDNKTNISSLGGASFLVENGGKMSGGITNAAGISIGGKGAAIKVTGTGSDIGGVGINNISGPIGGTTAAVVVRTGGNISGGIHNGGDLFSSTTHTNAVIQVLGASANISGGVENKSTGRIIGNDFAIQVSGNAGISGGISNSGKMTGKNYAIQVNGGTVGNGVYNGIVNSGSITTTATGAAILLMSSSGVTGNIDNSGTINSAGNAIQLIGGSTVSGNISNTGIFTTGAGANAGILIDGTSIVSASIGNGVNGHMSGSNFGIEVLSTSTVGSILNDTGAVIQASVDNIAVKNAHVTGTITNNGTLSGGATGILLATNAVAAGIVNSGTISASAKGINVNGASSITTSGIANSGSIIGGVAVNDIGISLSGNAVVTGNLVNSGIISKENAGIVVFQSVLNGDIKNSGSIQTNTTVGISASTTATIGSILNDTGATINSTAQNISMVQNSKATGALTNKGILTGGLTGIFLTTNASVATGLTNTGRIVASKVGINLQGSAKILANGLTNSGTISATAATGIALSLGTGSSITGDVTNSGTIHSGGNAIKLTTSSTVSGNISNTGIITAGAGANAGIFIDGTSHVTGSIGNGVNGQISGSNFGIEVLSNSTVGSILNDTGAAITSSTENISVSGSAHVTGAITNKGALAGGKTGIVINNAVIAGGIANTGTITGTAATNDAGIHVFAGAAITGNIANSGTIAQENTGIVISATTLNGDIKNTGAIQTNTSIGILAAAASTLGSILNDTGALINSTAQNIKVYQSSKLTGSLTNKGVLTGGSTGILLESSSSIATGLSNTGTIVATKAGIKLAPSGSVTANGLTNSGTISATASTGILISSGSAITGTVANTGTIFGDKYAFNLGNGASITGAFTNSTLIKSNGIGVKFSDGAGTSLGFTNGGTILGGNSGIQLYAGGHVTGTLNNTGLIQGTNGIGIKMYNGAYMNKLDNSGQIKGKAEAIDLNGGAPFTTGLTNQAGGLISATTGIALHVAGGANTSNLDNSGTIAGQNQAIYLDLNGTIGNITNNTGGLIKSTVSNAIDVTGTASAANIGAITNATGATINGGLNGILLHGATAHLTGDIDNRGLLKGGTGAGIQINTAAVLTGNITNNSGGTISSANDGIATGNGTTVTGAITNSGIIKGTAGAGINYAGLNNTGINNNAGATISGGQYGIELANTASLGGALMNAGYIKGAKGISLTGGVITSNIVNATTGTIEGTGGTAVQLDNNVNNATLLINGGRIIGNVVDSLYSTLGKSQVNIGGTFSTEGNFSVKAFTVNAGKALTVKATNTVNVGSALALNGSTVTIDVNSTAVFGKFVSLGTTDLTGATFKVTTAASPSLTDGDTLKIIDGAVNITGGPGDVTPVAVTDTSLLWDFKIVEGAYNSMSNDSDLYLLVSAFSGGGCTGNTNTSGNTSACITLQANSSTTDPQLQQILSNVNGAGTSQTLNSLLSSTQPDVNGGMVQESLLVANDALKMNETRLASLRNDDSGMSAGNSLKKSFKEKMAGLRGWIQTFGASAHQGTRDNIGGYSAQTTGLAAGIDSGHNLDGKVVGFAFSYGHTNIGSNNANRTDTAVNSYQLSAYGNYDLPKSSYLQGMAALTWHNIDTTRHDVGGVAGLNANGNFSAHQFTLGGKYARDFKYKNTIITPALTARWTNYNAQSYTETGAGGADLHVDYKNLNVFELGPEVAARWKHKYADGSYLVPELSLGYRYDLVGDNIEAASSFTGATGTIASTGATPARSSINFGAKATLYTANDWDISADYNFDYKSQYVAHSGYLRVGHKF